MRMTDPGGLASIVIPLLAVAATWYSIRRGVKRDRKTTEETIDAHLIALIQSAQDVQAGAIGRAEAEIVKLRTRNDTLHDSVNRAIGKLGIAETSHRQCQIQLEQLEERLHAAEAKIAELGG
jgi:hypothetical protein